MSFARVSVVIPTWNRCDLLRVTLRNVCSQTLVPYEVIVVDDNSTDGTREMLATEFKDKVIYIKNPKHGPGAARNAGLKVATGEYIKFFDSDDLMSANTLEVQVRMLEQTSKPYITSGYFYAHEKDEQWIVTDNTLINFYGFPQQRPLTHWMIWGLFITIPSMLFRKNFLDEVGEWPEEMVTSEDWAYLWRIAMLEPFPAHTSECSFLYRVHGNQSTGINMNDVSRDKEKFKVLTTIYERDVRNGAFSWFEKQMFLNKFYQMYLVCNDQDFKQELKKYRSVISDFIWQWYRMKMKMGRNKTKSNWQPMHGIEKSEVLISQFIGSCITHQL